MAWKPAIPEGLTAIQRVDLLALHCDDRLRTAGSLKEMTDDWVFFTIGCIYTYGGLDYDIVAEYTQTHGDKDCVVMTVTAPWSIFTGMLPPGWPDREPRYDHELCATPQEFWPGLRDHICQTGMVDRRKGRYAQVNLQELEIVDFVAIERAIVADRKVPTLKIGAFGVDCTTCHTGFVSRVIGPRDSAMVIKLPIREVTLQVGRAVLAGDPYPLRPLEPKPADPATVKQKVKEAKGKN
jgi:hypothetical protein